MRKLIVVMLILALGIIGGCGAKQTQNGTQGSSEKKILRVGSEVTYAPFEFQDEKTHEYSGFDMDLIKEIGKAAGYDEVKIENIAWEGLIPSLNSGKIDLVIAAMTITDERKNGALFSDRYFQSTQYIAIKEGSTVKNAQDLKGKKVGVQTNTTGQFVAEKLSVKDIKKFDTIPDALNALKLSSVDAVVADSPVVLWFIKQNPEAKIAAIDGNFEKEYFGMAMKLGNEALATKINAGLKQTMENQKYAEIYKKYFQVDAPKF